MGRPGQLFVAAISLSAFLLFTLELLSGRLVLPVFGGTPGVWATTLCFFTAMLFVGYLYAHIVATRLDVRQGGILHLGVATIAVVATFLAPLDVTALRIAGLPEALNVLLAQALLAGPAAFLLAATTPLLSAWYARRGEDPWWLYAASNGASFAALLAYPFLFEPTIGLSAQRLLLSIGLVAFTATLAAIVAPVLRRPTAAANKSEQVSPAQRLTPNAHGNEPDPTTTSGLTRRRQAAWLFAAMVPAGLLAATTNFITTDLISAPLLWVGPLAIYLLTFVVAFSERGHRVVRLANRLAPAAATLLWIPWVGENWWPISALLTLELGALFVLSLAIHGRLAGDRPDARQLTRFYLVISAGGMLATGFVAIAAPLLFPDVYEYPILILAGLIALIVLPGSGPSLGPISRRPAVLAREAADRLLPFVVAGAILLALIALDDTAKAIALAGLFGVGFVAITVAVRPPVLVVVTGLAIVALSGTSSSMLLQRRTFYGVLEVRADQTAHAEFSGTTLHGFQFLDETARREPTSYYGRSGPLGQIVGLVRERVASPSIAVVGLGAGTTIAYARPGDSFTFFEIDPATVEIARDPTYFRYLSDSPVAPRIVIGDARLSLAAEPPGSFDLLILDAFSSDSVPTHLLTREAMAVYSRTLRPGGLLLLHTTNRYYRLESAVVATARASGLGALARTYVPEQNEQITLGVVGSIWVIAGESAAIPAYRALGWGDPSSGPVLTDDFSDLLRTLRLG